MRAYLRCCGSTLKPSLIQGGSMHGITTYRIGLSALVLTMAGMLAAPLAHSQTAGMERRGDVRDTRQDGRKDGRQAKQDCKGSGETRSECRQEKRNTKQDARGDARDTRRGN